MSIDIVDIKLRARKKQERYMRMYPCRDHWDYANLLLKRLDKAVREWKETSNELHSRARRSTDQLPD